MGETVPPEWPRFMFHADGRSQQFASQEEVEATGEPWHRTPQEAQQAQQASQARQQSHQASQSPQASQGPHQEPTPPENEGSTGEAPPPTPRRR
jgi:hypothetical protein